MKIAELLFGYLCVVRPLDPIKEKKIIKAVFTLAGRKGLAGINIAGISKEAAIGVGTLYIYFKNKEDLVQAAYASIEHDITEHIYKGIDSQLPVKDSFKKIYRNIINYRLRHYNESVFTDQYIQSNYVQINLPRQMKEFEAKHKPLYDLLQQGQEEGCVAKMSRFMMISFINAAARSCSNGIIQKITSVKKRTIEDSFQMAWRGISTETAI